MDELPPKTELIDGELVVSDPTFRHDDLVMRIVRSYILFETAHGSPGRMGTSGLVRAGERDGYSPDVWWVPTSTTLPPETGVFPSSPALVVEVRSPRTWHHDRGHKLRKYEARRVAEVWLVDGVNDEITVHRRSLGSDTFDVVLVLRPGDVLTTALVPGWRVDLGEVFVR